MADKKENKNEILELKEKIFKSIDKDLDFNEQLKKKIKTDDKRALNNFNVYLKNKKYIVSIIKDLSEIEAEYQDNVIEVVLCDELKEYCN